MDLTCRYLLIYFGVKFMIISMENTKFSWIFYMYLRESYLMAYIDIHCSKIFEYFDGESQEDLGVFEWTCEM